MYMKAKSNKAIAYLGCFVAHAMARASRSQRQCQYRIYSDGGGGGSIKDIYKSPLQQLPLGRFKAWQRSWAGEVSGCHWHSQKPL